MDKLPLIRNSIPQQNLGPNQRLSVKAWNNYINVLREQTNANTRFLKALDEAVIKTGALSDGSINAIFQDPEVINIISNVVDNYIISLASLPVPDQLLLTTEEPPAGYSNNMYGKVLDSFEI